MTSAETTPLLHVVLWEPEIPQNTGSIGRLCLGTGCRLHLIEPLGFSIDEKAVRRAGLDYWKNVDLRVYTHFEQVVAALGSGRLYLASARRGRPYTQHHFQRGDALVLGRESVGLPDWMLDQFPEQILNIPTPGPIRSLNLSNAASVLVYEGLRQLQPQLFYPA